MEYRGKGVVVTGAASGIGLESAIAFANAGASVCLADIEVKALRLAEARVRQVANAPICTQYCDVSQKNDIEQLAEFAFSKLENVDVVFHNAGVGVSGPIIEMSDEDWRWVIDVNLWGCVYIAQTFVPKLRQQRRQASLVYTSSFAGLVPSANLGPYSVSKSGVISLAEVLRQELREANISVSVVCPMRVATNIGTSGRNRKDEKGLAGSSPEITDPSDDNLVGSVITPAEVARQVMEGIENRDLYIMTHGEGRQYVESRFAKMANGFARRDV